MFASVAIREKSLVTWAKGVRGRPEKSENVQVYKKPSFSFCRSFLLLLREIVKN